MSVSRPPVRAFMLVSFFLAALGTVPVASARFDSGAGPTAVATADREVVTFSRVGSLRLGESTEADVVDIAGNPDDVDESEEFSGLHRYFGYRCGGQFCVTTYDLLDGVLVGFASRSKSFSTSRGSRPGLRRRTAERRERRKARVGCAGLAISRTRIGDTLDLLFSRGKVSVIVSHTSEAGSFFGC